VERLAQHIGVTLRDARRRRDLTLRDVSNLSGGRFKPTSVAGYERGERAISLERFIELAKLYRVPPHLLVAEIVRAIDAVSPQPDVDLIELESSESTEEALVAGFVRQIRALRRQQPTALSLRAGDLEVLATAAAKRLNEVLETLEPEGEEQR
jgi:transcriptional regulator with XRE-family HTH domain